MNTSNGYTDTPTGYIVRWSKLNAAEVSTIIEDGVEFLEVCAEYTLYDRILNVKVLINGGQYTNIHVNNSYTPEFLTDLGVPCEDTKYIKANTERFILSLIKETSTIKSYSTPVKNLMYQKQQKQPKNPLILNDEDINWLHKFNSREKTLREIDQEKEINALKKTIEDLKSEMEDLKEEIELLNAIKEEC